MVRYLTLLLTLLAPLAVAETVTITDTSGTVRAEQVVEGNQSSVQFTVTDASGAPVDGAEVTLKNQVTGEVLVQQSVNGSVVFENVSAGQWVVSTSSAQLALSGVVIAPAGFGGGLGALGLSSTALTIGGITAVTATTVAIAANNDDDDDELSPSS